MASLCRKPRSKNWIGCFTGADGKQRQRSTGTPDKKAALKIVQAYEAAWRTARCASQVRAVMNDALVQCGGDPSVAISFKDYAERWLGARKAEVRPVSFVAYEAAIRHFCDHLGDAADRDMATLTRVHVCSFRDAKAAQTSARTASNQLTILRIVFKNAVRDRILLESPADGVAPAKGGAGSAKRVFTVDELKAIVAVSDPEWRSMILFALYCGQRLSDVASLRWSNVDMAAGVLRLTTRKTGRRMVIPIAGPLRDHIATLAAPATDGPLHPKANEILEREGRAGTLSRHFAAILEAAGLRTIPPRRPGVGRGGPQVRHPLSFHTLRATATTWMHESGIPLATVQALIGHSGDATHALYTRIGEESLRAGVNSLPDLGS